jgi:hypothetical protein
VFKLLQSVGGAANAVWVSIQHVGINHCGSDVVVAEYFLDRSNVLAALH